MFTIILFAYISDFPLFLLAPPSPPEGPLEVAAISPDAATLVWKPPKVKFSPHSSKSRQGPAPMALWSKVLPLTASCL